MPPPRQALQMASVLAMFESRLFALSISSFARRLPPSPAKGHIENFPSNPATL
jgi:hypothetical protein